MMWEIKGNPVSPQRFMPFVPVRVLNYYDGPRIFTFIDADEELCLACWSDEDDTHSRFLVVTVTDQAIAELESGLLSVREALTQQQVWVVDMDPNGDLDSAWLLSHRDIPENAQPQPKTMLHRSLEPDLSRVVTGGIFKGEETLESITRGIVK